LANAFMADKLGGNLLGEGRADLAGPNAATGQMHSP